MQRSYNIEKFIRFFWAFIVSIGAELLCLWLASEDEDLAFLFIIAGIAVAFFFYSMMWALCDDILDRKGYSRGEIPLVRIVIVFGLFAFVYLLLLPIKGAAVMPSTVTQPVSTDNTTVKRESIVCKHCGYENYADNNSLLKNTCKQCGKTLNITTETDDSYWKCPKCGKKNLNSSRVCKDCEYQK
ncbi:MAG: hypothetical protein ACI4KH_00065 [Oscillospiraceae bacterium]